MLTCVGSDEIARLRRIAFGSGSSAQERADAAAALRALSDRATTERAEVGEPESEFYAEAGAQPVETDHLVSAFDDATQGASTGPVVDEDDEKSIWQRRIRFGWLIPDSGGGHINAANAAFEVPEKGYETYPVTALRNDMGVDQSQARLAVVDNGHKLWVVKQGQIGFCLASYDVRTSEGMYECATIEKFKQSGVAMIVTEFAAWWDGKSFVISG